MMAPFKFLLSPKTNFKWTEELEIAFQKSKAEIVSAIRRGVEIYDPGSRTCLQTDYSTQGIGYWLRQKYCSCNSIRPDCCMHGWGVTLAGSRFLRDAEKRYSPIEGECLAIAWGLEDTRWFAMGCVDLTVATDHKPLLKILGDKRLDGISNPRLFHLKQRTMMWHFTIVHIPGASNVAADATSRNQSTGNETSFDALTVVRLTPALDDMEADIIAGAQASA